MRASKVFEKDVFTTIRLFPDFLFYLGFEPSEGDFLIFPALLQKAFGEVVYGGFERRHKLSIGKIALGVGFVFAVHAT